MTRAGPNETGSLLHEPIPKLLSAQHYHLRRAAQPCPHVATVTERTSAGHVHFARVKCRSCGAFLRWSPRPGTVQRRQLNGYRLARLGMCANLSDWERGFVESLSQQRKFLPRQLQIFDRLCAEYLEARTT
jgi:hypothetical protein